MEMQTSKSGILKSHGGELSALQHLVDGVIILVAHYYWVFAYSSTGWVYVNTVVTLVAVLGFHLSAEVTGLYRSWRGARLRQQTLSTLATWGIVVALLLLLAFATKTSEDFSRVATFGWFATVPPALIVWRAALRYGLGEARRRGYNTKFVAVVGATATAEKLLYSIDEQPTLGLKIVGYYDDRKGARQHPIPEKLAQSKGGLDQLVEDARNGLVDIVYIALSMRAEIRTAELIRRLADTTVSVYLVPDFRAYDLLRARWSSLGEMQVASIFDTPFEGLGGWAKRAEDLVLGSIFLGIASPVMMAVAVAIKLTSRGPVFFRQRRYGLNGKEIHVWKFRSMTVCEDASDVKQATKNDQRITRVGAFLRRSSLDELPQLFNVVMGEMSIVGPRPHAVAHNELYRSKIHGYMLRHKVKPGITGWAQVNGWRGETDTVEKMEKRIEHDLYYIHNWRLDWDLYIIFMTVFGRKVWKNAY